jgi:hypothetical protein
MGYPLLQYEGAVPMRLSLVAWRTTHDPTTRRLQGHHVAREDNILQGINGGSGPHGKVSDPCISGPDLRAGSRTSAGIDQTPGTGLGPLYVGYGPPSAGSRDSGTKNTQALIKTKRGSGADTCQDHTMYTSAPRSGGDPMQPRGLLPMT